MAQILWNKFLFIFQKTFIKSRTNDSVFFESVLLLYTLVPYIFARCTFNLYGHILCAVKPQFLSLVADILYSSYHLFEAR